MTPILTVPFSAAKGRVLDLVIYSQSTEGAIVRWRDGAYSFIGYQPAYEAGDGNLCDEPWGDRVFLEEELILAGIATKEDLDRDRVERQVTREKEQRAERFRMFRHLKQEFEPGT